MLQKIIEENDEEIDNIPLEEEPQDFDSLKTEYTLLKQKFQKLNALQLETLGELDSEKFISMDLTIKLQKQEQHFKDKVYSQMILLQEKAKEQEIFIQSIRENMQQTKQSFHDKNAELENKKKKLQKANKEAREIQKQVKSLQEEMEIVRFEMSERENEILELKKENEKIKSGQNKENAEIIEEKKELESENQRLQRENRAIMMKNQELKKYLDSIKSQNLRPLDVLIFDQNTEEVPQAPVPQVSDAPALEMTMGAPEGQEQEFYNPIPQRQFNKLKQPSIRQAHKRW